VNGRFEWRFEDAPNNFESPLWPIVRSAAELLASDQSAVVRACASHTCQWIFLDTSKNHRQRRCDMTSVGTGQSSADLAKKQMGRGTVSIYGAG
jgi:predicted RNA-binding Zn ribbon-like protein